MKPIFCRPSRATPPDLQNHDVRSVPPEKVPVTLSGSELNHWTIAVRKPVVETPPRLDIPDDVIPDFPDKPGEVISQPLQPDTPTHVVERLAGGPGAGFPETADFYPPPSVRLGEEGMSTVQVCVDRKGRLTSDPTTVKGSGILRLDEAALMKK